MLELAPVSSSAQLGHVGTQHEAILNMLTQCTQLPPEELHPRESQERGGLLTGVNSVGVLARDAAPVVHVQ